MIRYTLEEYGNFHGVRDTETDEIIATFRSEVSAQDFMDRMNSAHALCEHVNCDDCE